MTSTSSESPRAQLQFCRFAVHETPVCVWSDDINRDNLRYLKNIDPEYFETIADILTGSGFDGPDGQSRSVAIRMLYGQASEALLALLAATVQAPDCVPGWMGRYQNRDLEELIRKISRGERILTKFKSGHVTWESLAAFVHQHLEITDADVRAHTIAGFARFWRRLASEYLESHVSREYNAIKHGLRTRAGGFSLALGENPAPGVPCPPEKMKSLGGSPFGTSTITPIKIDGTKWHYRLGSVANNWDPKVLANRLSLITISHGNLLARLRVFAGDDPDQLILSRPADLAAFDHGWPARSWPFNFTYGPVVKAEHLTPMSDDDILAVYHSQETDRNDADNQPPSDVAAGTE